MVPQRQSFASTYSKVALSRVEADVASTSVIRTSPVMAESAKPPVYIGENGVASISSFKPKESTSTETPVPTKKSTSLCTKALSPSAVNPQLYVDDLSSISLSTKALSPSAMHPRFDVSSTLSSVILKPETLTPVTTASSIKSLSAFTETSAFEPSKPSPHSAIKTQSHTHISESPTSSPPTPSRQPIDYKLILCVAVPLFAVLVFVIVIAMVLCIRRYRK